MNVEKARKRIAKQVKKGFHGYPIISLAYFGETSDLATEVVISFVLEEGDAPQEQKFHCEKDVRGDATIQSILVKIIERANAGTVTESESVSIIA